MYVEGMSVCIYALPTKTKPTRYGSPSAHYLVSEETENLCIGLNENDPYRPIKSGTIRRCGLVERSVSQGVGFEVSAQAKFSGSLAIPAAHQSRYRTLNYFSGTMSACVQPYFLP